MASKSTRHGIKAVILSVLFIASLIIVPFIIRLIGFNYIYGEGDRVGQIIKVSNKGLVWKTWEVGMGLTQSGAYVDYWNFSIDSQDPNQKELIKELTKAYNTGALVKIHYKQRYGTQPWRGDTEYFVQEIKFLEMQ